MGQRNSSNGGPPGTNPGVKRNSNNHHQQTNSPQVGAGGRNSPSNVASPGSLKGKKVVKASLRDAPASKKTPHSKTKLPISNSQSSNSPSSLPGRVLQKTATVSPAPEKTTPITSGSLPRFGFRSCPVAIASGGSTDSVNSILSDAQTTSDANSNVFDLGEENGNGSSSGSVNNYSHLVVCGNESTTPTVDGTESPCTISQASSGVTSAVLNGKYKAQTKQLPSPQIITVKPMNSKKQNNSGSTPTSKSKLSSPLSKKEVSSPQRTPAPASKGSKIPQNASKSSLAKSQRVSRDSESSNKSLNTVDSGLGSSSESDKCRSPESRLSKGKEKVLDTGQSREEESISSQENGFDLDLSDAWLKEKKSQLEIKKRLDTDPRPKSGSLLLGTSNLKPPGKVSQKDSFKEKRDSNITYGMARQKFAPYSRNRVALQHSNGKSNHHHHHQSDTIASKQDSLQSKVSSAGVVRSRIAQLEKTPLVAAAEIPQNPPKKPVARPTSIEKTPILVSSGTENTIELSRSICRRLEYSEGKSTLLDSTKDNKTESRLIEVPNTAQDFLMVDSFEVKKEVSRKMSELYDSSVDTNKISVNLPSHKTDADHENSELKRIKDITECENSTKRLGDGNKGSSQDVTGDILNLPLQDLSTKVFSPDGSETSFEVIESGSVDCSPREDDESEHVTSSYLNQLVAGFANSCAGVGISAKHLQTSPSRATPLKKSRQDLEREEVPKNQEESLPRVPSLKNLANCKNSSVESPQGGTKPAGMESSIDSNRSAMSDSGDRWTVSGKCTPTLSSTRGDVDQDFLIDDEISDQPGLTFGDDLDASLFGDEDLFSDISSHSASHLLSKTDRSRHGSMGTTSSIGPDDLMLDYDLEDAKQIGSSVGTLTREKAKTDTPKKKAKKKPVIEVTDISLPGPRYEEEVLSPVACDILSEWSAILAGTQTPSRSNSQSCISQQNSVVSTAACTNSIIAGEVSHHKLASDVTTQQPLTAADSLSADRTSVTSSRNVGTETDGPPPSPDKKTVNLKPPRQGVSSEHEGGLNIDRTTLHYMCQDVTAMKTLLLRLRRVLQVTDTLNPFDANLKTSLYLNLGANESPDKEDLTSVQEVVQQNVDLKRQVVLLQQRLEEKDRTIRSLQQQLANALEKRASQHPLFTPTSSSSLISSSSPSDDGMEPPTREKSVANAATQTDRFSQRTSPFALASMSRTSSIEDGLGPTVSFEDSTVIGTATQCPNALEPTGKTEDGSSASKKNLPPEFLSSPASKLTTLVPLTPAVPESFVS